MLRLMRFGVYFERILKIKSLFSYRNNYSIHGCIPWDLSKSIMHYLRGSEAYVIQENFENMVQFGAFWCII